MRTKHEADKNGTVLRVYHDNHTEKRIASRAWTHPVDEWCITCETHGRLMPVHIRAGEMSPTPDTLKKDRAALTEPRARKGRGGAREALAALRKEGRVK
jgi:hypothetical protein